MQRHHGCRLPEGRVRFLAMHLPRTLARLNRRVINPIQMRYAGAIPFHGIVEHEGRRTGRAYRTPVLVFRSSGRFCMIVGYGLGSDWVRNLLAGGGGALRHRRSHYHLTDPRLLRGTEAYSALPPLMAAFARLVRIDGVLVVSAAEG